MDSIALEIPPSGTTLASVVDLIFKKYPEMELWKDKLLFAVNCEFADLESMVKEGDEIALMPPVQGG